MYQNLVLSLLLLATAPEAPPSPAGVSLVQTTSFPGQDGRAQTGTMTVHLAAHRMALVPSDPNGITLIIRLDGQPGIWELDPATRTYKTYRITTLAEKRVEAERNREKQRADLRAIHNEAEKLQAARDIGINPQADASLRLVRPEEPARQIAGHTCRQVLIEREADPTLGRGPEPVLELWVTDELQAAASALTIYRDLGVFSAEEQGLLEQITGFPLAYRAVLPLGALEHAEFSGVASAVLPQAPPDAVFDLPEGYQEWLPPAAVCHMCSKEIADPANNPHKLFHAKSGWMQFCSEECETDFMLQDPLPQNQPEKPK